MKRQPIKVNLPDGDWVRLGATHPNQDRAITTGQGQTWLVKEGEVIHEGFGLTAIVKSEELSVAETRELSIVAASRLAAHIDHKVGLSKCEPIAAETLLDGLWVCRELAISYLVFGGEIVMSGSYKRVKQEVSA